MTKPNNFKINRIQESDIPKLYKLDAEIFGDLAYPYFVIRQFFNVHQNLFFVLRNNEEIVGYCLAGFNVKNKESWILGLGIVVDFRGKGMGKELMSRMEKELIILGCNKASASVGDKNNIVLNFYKSMGYINSGLLKNFYGMGMTRIKMIKTF